MFMVLITIVTGAYKPTYNWGAPHCSYSMSPKCTSLISKQDEAGLCRVEGRFFPASCHLPMILPPLCYSQTISILIRKNTENTWNLQGLCS